MKELRSRIRFPQSRAEVLNARDIWQCLETVLVVIIWGGRRGATASNGWRPGTLLNILQDSPHHRESSSPRAHSVQGEKPWPRHTAGTQQILAEQRGK